MWLRELRTTVWAWFRLAATFASLIFSAALPYAGCGTKNQIRAATPMPRFHPWWVSAHLARLDEVRSPRGQVDLIFIGDSITANYALASGDPAYNFLPIWDKYFAPHQALNLGVDGDQTQQVLWRLAHGEVAGLAPAHVVLLIGTNNLQSDEPSVEDIVAGIAAVIASIHNRMPAAHVLVLSILPTTFSARRTARTNAVNTAIQARVSSESYAVWVSLDDIFMDGKRVRTELYYDPQMLPGAAALHPNATGQQLMAQRVAGAFYGKL